VIGGIVSGRVPVGNAAGHRFSSWLGPTSVALGVLFVATAAYLAAVYLAADASRLRRTDLERRFQVRGLAMAVVAGAAAVAGLVAVHHDARSIWDGLTSGAGLGAVIASAVAGVATVTLLLRQRYAWARISAATAVAAIVAGWGAAQHPTLLPGLTVHQGAAEHSVLVALILVLALGAFVLIPSLVLLFSLVLHGRFDTEREATNHVDRGSSRVRLSRLLVPAIACLAVGTVTTVIPDAAWGRIVGIPLLLAFVGFGFVALAETITTSSD
jgi:cytochrome d ubiquinol oxidase subunit II